MTKPSSAIGYCRLSLRDSSWKRRAKSSSAALAASSASLARSPGLPQRPARAPPLKPFSMSPSHGAAASDSDDDIFTINKTGRPMSMYSLKSAPSDSDSDSDVVPLKLVAPSPRRKRGRGRPPKRGRGASAGSRGGRSPQAKRPRASVFEISSDDEDDVKEVTPPSRGAQDTFDAATRHQLELARRALEGANAGRIEEEAAQQARQDVERAAREGEEEARRKREAAQRAEAEKKRTEEAATSAPVMLKVRSEKGEIKVRIRKLDPVLKMLPPYCKKFGLDQNLVRLTFDGEDVEPNDTPDSLELEDGMVIDALIRKTR